MKGKILLVEDDMALAMGTRYTLEAEGYEVLQAGSVREAEQMLSGQPDLILLDVMLPDGDGFSLCRKIRNVRNMVPIIFLTAVEDEVNVVQGLEMGADDYVTKPYRVKELLSRIAANLRRSGYQKGEQEKVIHFGNHAFHRDAFRLYEGERLVDCSAAEMRIIAELLKHQGNVLTRGQLLDHLYADEGNLVDDNTLSVYMKRLRDKLGADSAWIETVRGVGYRFRKQEDME